MITKKFKGTVGSMWGIEVKPALSFEGTYQAYESHDEIVERNDLPSHDEILKWRNDDRKQNQRQQAMLAALDAAGYKKPTLEDEATRVKEMVKIFMAIPGTSLEIATQKARAALGIVDGVAE